MLDVLAFTYGLRGCLLNFFSLFLNENGEKCDYSSDYT
jgi:hypothetical protein